MAASDEVAVSKPVLELIGVSKYYPGVTALSSADFAVSRGSVHALVGQNGAGKSTLMKVAAGAVQPERGSMLICGSPVRTGRPLESSQAGLAMMYQELTVIPEMTALDNVLLSNPPRRFGVVSRRRGRGIYRRVSELLRTSIPEWALGRDLSTAQQQMLEIMRILVENRQVVVMDEPTASLGPQERVELHRIIKVLRAEGHSIVLISHDLDEVLEVSDDVTVMRDGHVIRTAPVGEWTKDSLIDAMVGAADYSFAQPKSEKSQAVGSNSSEVVLRISDLVAPGIRAELLELRAGEIVGIGGLIGSGRTELLRAIVGASYASSGSIEIAGGQSRWPATPRHALQLGLALAPEDRKREGLVLDQSSSFNIVLPSLHFAGARGVITQRRIAHQATAPGKRVGLSPTGLRHGARTLSGGNQQKLLLARWIYSPQVRILLLDEPTRGIDVMSKFEIFQTMANLAQSGISILWVSSDLDEVVAHSHRVLVVAKNELSADLGSHATVEDILRHSFGIERSINGDIL